MNTILVFIPTYNERGNIERLYQEIKKLSCPLDILFCDDNSPDKTADIIDNLAQMDTTVKCIKRPCKMGLGTAHIEGYNYAKKHNYDYLITMDADFTHDPCYIPALIEQKDQADIVIGSRYMHGGTMEGWGKLRLPLTLFWKKMINLGLNMPYDCTGAFRMYRVSILNSDVYSTFNSRGFSFGMEALYRFKQHGATITEIPIHARNRQEGKSKLSVKIMSEFACQYLKLTFERLLKKRM